LQYRIRYELNWLALYCGVVERLVLITLL